MCIRDRVPPIYTSATFAFPDVGYGARCFTGEESGYFYTRIANPTLALLEGRLASLEQGVGAVVFGSGMGAITATLWSMLEPGDEVLADMTLYGCTLAFMNHGLTRFGVTVRHVDMTDPAQVQAAMGPKTKVVYCETPANPNMRLVDIAAVAQIAHAGGAKLIVDNTYCTPYLQQPLLLGADVSVHSMTKYLGGHGTTMGGIVVESGKFPWDNGNFPPMTEPSRGYHGVRFFETFGDFGFTMKARMETMRTLGPTLAPFSAFLLMQGIETLHLRMPRHCESAMAVANHLAAHPSVAWVRYPGMPGQPDDALVRRYLPKGAGGILTFGVKGGAKAGERVIESVEFLSHLANVGDAKSLIIHPASTTHRQLDEAEQRAAGVTPEMIRLSVGLESLDDILWDLDQALARAEAA